MSNKNSPAKYSEELKKTIVTLYQSGKTYADIKKEYGVSSSALSTLTEFGIAFCCENMCMSKEIFDCHHWNTGLQPVHSTSVPHRVG